MSEIRRYGTSKRWADVVVHRGVAYWVEVAEDTSLDTRGQIAQVLAQLDATLGAIKSGRRASFVATWPEMTSRIAAEIARMRRPRGCCSVVNWE